jgi:hypothetical protein
MKRGEMKKRNKSETRKGKPFGNPNIKLFILLFPSVKYRNMMEEVAQEKSFFGFYDLNSWIFA